MFYRVISLSLMLTLLLSGGEHLASGGSHRRLARITDKCSHRRERRRVGADHIHSSSMSQARLHHPGSGLRTIKFAVRRGGQTSAI